MGTTEETERRVITELTHLLRKNGIFLHDIVQNLFLVDLGSKPEY